MLKIMSKRVLLLILTLTGDVRDAQIMYFGR